MIPETTIADHMRSLERHRLTLLAVAHGPNHGLDDHAKRSWWNLSAPDTGNNAMDITFGPGGIVLHGDAWTKPVGADHKDLSWWLNTTSHDYFLGKFLKKVYDHDEAMIDVLAQAMATENDADERERWQAVYDDGPEDQHDLYRSMVDEGITDVGEYRLGMVWDRLEGPRLLAVRRTFERLHARVPVWTVGMTVSVNGEFTTVERSR